MIIARLLDTNLIYKSQLSSCTQTMKSGNLKFKHNTIYISKETVNSSNKILQDLHKKNYKTLMKEIKEGINKWRRDKPC